MAQKPINDSDFFALLDEGAEQGVSGVAQEEVFVRDASGRLLVLRNGSLVSVESASAPALNPIKSTVSTPTDPLQGYLDELAKELPQGLSDLHKARALAIFRSRLKGIRNAMQTREMILRSADVGGLGWSAAQADTFLIKLNALASHISGEITTLTPPPRPTAPAARPTPSPAQPPLPPKPKPVPPAPATPVAPSAPKLLEPVHELKELPAPASTSLRPKPVALSPIGAPTPRPIPSPRASTPLVPVAPLPPKPKPQVQVDVKPLPQAPKLMGPIEELRQLTLEDFRRSGTASAATEKIWSTVQLLEVDSFTKKMEGIKAWKQSPVNRLYLELGNISMEKQQPVREVIASHQSSKQSTLTVEEFEAVMDLNRRLRT